MSISKKWLDDYKLKAESMLYFKFDTAQVNLAKIILKLIKEIHRLKQK
jgi:hypothetical protein